MRDSKRRHTPFNWTDIFPGLDDRRPQSIEEIQEELEEKRARFEAARARKIARARGEPEEAMDSESAAIDNFFRAARHRAERGQGG